MAIIRNPYIDFLRFIGISLVILAHVNTPAIIHQIRCFDVPLMVFVSGLSYSGKNLDASLQGYFWPRIKRLLMPVYIFLCMYFLAFAAFGKVPSVQTIAASFALFNDGSIGYVWIIKVFLLIMLVTPFLLKISNKINAFCFWAIIIGLLLVEDIICSYILPGISNITIRLCITETLPYLIGYSVVFMLGVRCRSIDNRDENISLAILFAMACGIFLLNMYSGKSLNLQAYKYPPQSYFLIYGMSVSAILWKLRNITVLQKSAECRFTQFVGQNTIWIYLWHIIFVIIANKFIVTWGGRYIFVYSAALLCFFIQHRIVKKLKDRYGWTFLKYFIG